MLQTTLPRKAYSVKTLLAELPLVARAFLRRAEAIDGAAQGLDPMAHRIPSRVELCAEWLADYLSRGTLTSLNMVWVAAEMLDRIVGPFEESARAYAKTHPAVGDSWIALVNGLAVAARIVAAGVKASVEKVDEDSIEAAGCLSDGEWAYPPSKLKTIRLEILLDILSRAAASYAAELAAFSARQAAAPPVTTTPTTPPTPPPPTPRQLRDKLLADLADLSSFAPAPVAEPDRLYDAADDASAEADRRHARHKQLNRLAADLDRAMADAQPDNLRLIPAPTVEQLVERQAVQHARQAAAAVVALIEAGIDAAFEQEKPRRSKRCAAGRFRTFFEIKDVHRGFGGRLACGCLDCDYCRCRLRAFWKRHAATCVLHEVPAAGLPSQARNERLTVRGELPVRTHPVHFWFGDVAEDDRIKKRIDRACEAADMKSTGVRVVSAFGREVLFVAPVAFEGSHPVPPASAAKQLAEHIDMAKRRVKAVTSWGRWGTPKIIKTHQPVNHTKTPDEVRDDLDKARAAVKTFTPADPTVSSFDDGFAWRLPRSMSVRDVLVLYGNLDMDRPESSDSYAERMEEYLRYAKLDDKTLWAGDSIPEPPDNHLSPSWLPYETEEAGIGQVGRRETVEADHGPPRRAQGAFAGARTP